MLTLARISDPVALTAQVADVYRSAFSIFRDAPTDNEVRAFAHDTLPRHAARDGFRFIVALEESQLVGFIYGYHGRRGEWWEDWIYERLPAAVFEQWFDRQYDLTEFCVRADRRGEGVGSQLYEALFAELAEGSYERAVLTTRRIDNPARGFYLNRGWEVVWEALDDRFSLLGLKLG
ncbi:MAG TPA: GNAT family N-acetyltransferase [Solirubrobacteraceae bacterium]|nr:GNAT family N-acetyltransferase [Solirubrobacteraceae bacterium]